MWSCVFLTAGTCPYKWNSLWLQQLGAMYICASELVLAANAAIIWRKLTFAKNKCNVYCSVLHGRIWVFHSVWEFFLKSGRLGYRSQSRESGRTHSQEHSCSFFDSLTFVFLRKDRHCHVFLIKVFLRNCSASLHEISKMPKLLSWVFCCFDTPFWLCGGLKGTVISTSLYVPVSVTATSPCSSPLRTRLV